MYQMKGYGLWSDEVKVSDGEEVRHFKMVTVEQFVARSAERTVDGKWRLQSCVKNQDNKRVWNEAKGKRKGASERKEVARNYNGTLLMEVGAI